MNIPSSGRLSKSDQLKQSVLLLKSAYETRIWCKLHYVSPHVSTHNRTASRNLERADIENILGVLKKFAPQVEGFLHVSVRFLPKTSSLRKNIQNFLKILRLLAGSSSVNELMIRIGEEQIPHLGRFLLQLSPFILNRWTLLLLSSGSLASLFYYLNGLSTIKRFIINLFSKSNISTDPSAQQPPASQRQMVLARLYSGVSICFSKVRALLKIVFLHFSQIFLTKMNHLTNLDAQHLSSEMKAFFMTIGSIYSSANSSVDFAGRIVSRYYLDFVRELFDALKKHEQTMRQMAKFL